MEELLLLEDICPILHMGRTTAYRLIQSGQLPAQKIGGKWLIRADDFKKYLDGRFSAGAEQNKVKEKTQKKQKKS